MDVKKCPDLCRTHDTIWHHWELPKHRQNFYNSSFQQNKYLFDLII